MLMVTVTCVTYQLEWYCSVPVPKLASDDHRSGQRTGKVRGARLTIRLSGCSGLRRLRRTAAVRRRAAAAGHSGCLRVGAAGGDRGGLCPARAPSIIMAVTVTGMARHAMIICQRGRSR
jgi:hypothetical protein